MQRYFNELLLLLVWWFTWAIVLIMVIWRIFLIISLICFSLSILPIFIISSVVIWILHPVFISFLIRVIMILLEWLVLASHWLNRIQWYYMWSFSIQLRIIGQVFQEIFRDYLNLNDLRNQFFSRILKPIRFPLFKNFLLLVRIVSS